MADYLQQKISRLLEQTAQRLTDFVAGTISAFHLVDRAHTAILAELRAIRDEQASQRAILEQILAAQLPPPATRLIIEFEMEGVISEGGLNGMKAGGKARYTVTPQDDFGNLAKLDGPLNASISDETILRINSHSDDGLTGEIESVGLLGEATLAVDGDGDLGPGVKPVVASAVIKVDQPGDVTRLQLNIEEL